MKKRSDATQTLRAGSKADPQTNKHTNRQERLQYTVHLSAQCNEHVLVHFYGRFQCTHTNQMIITSVRCISKIANIAQVNPRNEGNKMIYSLHYNFITKVPRDCACPQTKKTPVIHCMPLFSDCLLLFIFAFRRKYSRNYKLVTPGYARSAKGRLLGLQQQSFYMPNQQRRGTKWALCFSLLKRIKQSLSFCHCVNCSQVFF